MSRQLGALRTKWNCGKELLSEMLVTWERECSLWTPFWNVCHVDMAIGMTPVHLVTLYMRRENVERENLYMSVMMTGKWNYVWSVG